MSKRPAGQPAAVRSSQRPRVAPGWRREGGAEELVAGPSHLVPSLRSRARALLTDARARELSRDDHVMHHMILAICASIYRAPDALASDKRPRPALGGAIGSHGCRSASSVLPFVPPSPQLSFCSVSPAVAFARGALLGRLRMLSLWLRLVCPPPRLLDAARLSFLLRQSCPVVGRAHDTSRLSFCFVSPAARLPRRRAGP